MVILLAIDWNTEKLYELTWAEKKSIENEVVL